MFSLQILNNIVKQIWLGQANVGCQVFIMLRTRMTFFPIVPNKSYNKDF